MLRAVRWPVNVMQLLAIGLCTWQDEEVSARKTPSRGALGAEGGIVRLLTSWPYQQHLPTSRCTFSRSINAAYMKVSHGPSILDY